jgi:hypothetical protein
VGVISKHQGDENTISDFNIIKNQWMNAEILILSQLGAEI